MSKRAFQRVFCVTATAGAPLNATTAHNFDRSFCGLVAIAKEVRMFIDDGLTLANNLTTITGLFLLASLILLVILSIRNIHLLRQRSDKISEQSVWIEHQRSALNQHAIVSIVNCDGLITYVNENFER